MSETTTETTAEETAAETSGDNTEATESATETDTAAEGEKSLGDAGKKALDAMKAKWKDAANSLAETNKRLAELEAKSAGKEAEFLAAQEAQRVKDDALAVANERILKAEVRAAAAAKLADPQDALRFLDLSEFEVDSEGAVDGAVIAAAIEDLIKTKPYLAAQGGQRFTGDADGGARKVTPPASIDEQIAELQKAGNYKAASAIKANQLLELRNSTT